MRRASYIRSPYQPRPRSACENRCSLLAGVGQTAATEDGRGPADDSHDDSDAETDGRSDNFAVAGILIAERERSIVSIHRGAGNFPQEAGLGQETYVPHWKQTMGRGMQSMANSRG